MAFLHNMKVFVLGSGSLAYHLVRHPVLSARMMFRMPWAMRGILDSEQLALIEGAPKSGERVPAESPNPLEQFFDARQKGRGIWKWRHYFEVYHDHLSRFIGRDVRMVEIGIHSGGSLEMWKDYLGPRCTIFGIDREPACKVYEDERTKVFIGDQEDHQFWRRFKDEVAPVDIVLDDGGHLPEQQLATFQELLPHLRPGGIYICEDVHGLFSRFSAYTQGFADGLNVFDEEHGDLDCRPSPLQSWAHSMHWYPYVFIVERRERPLLRMACEKHGTEWQPI